MQKLFDKTKVYLFAPTHTGEIMSQMMGYVITDGKSLIVIDGGTVAEANRLYELIKSLGGIVDLWILTHAHQDHIGAFTKIIEDKRDIEIKKLIYDFPPRKEVIEHLDHPVRVEVANRFFEVIKTVDIPHSIPTVDENIEIGIYGIEFFKRGNEIFSNNFNDTSLVFKLTTETMPILFPADLGPVGWEKLKSEMFDLLRLKCPICQMAHHGQNGCPKDFYEFVSPKYALWNSTTWLYNNDLGEGFNTAPYASVETRGWLEELGAISFTAFDETLIIE